MGKPYLTLGKPIVMYRFLLQVLFEIYDIETQPAVEEFYSAA